MAISARDGDPGSDQNVSPGGKHSGARKKNTSDEGGWGRALKETVIIVVLALVISAVVRAFLVQAFYVPSESMENTLQVSDRIIASKITKNLSGVQRGEVVVFKDPGGWLPPAPEPAGGVRGAIRTALTFIGVLPSDSGQDLVKRVIAVGGDHIACCDAQGRIVLNGVALNETYIKHAGSPDATNQVRFDVTVPDGYVFVMGDNRGNSRDSRYHLDYKDGGVPTDSVVGKVFVVVWPFARWAVVPIPEIFGNPALNAG